MISFRVSFIPWPFIRLIGDVGHSVKPVSQSLQVFIYSIFHLCVRSSGAYRFRSYIFVGKEKKKTGELFKRYILMRYIDRVMVITRQHWPHTTIFQCFNSMYISKWNFSADYYYYYYYFTFAKYSSWIGWWRLDEIRRLVVPIIVNSRAIGILFSKAVVMVSRHCFYI